jgi:hypothetical protein
MTIGEALKRTYGTSHLPSAAPSRSATESGHGPRSADGRTDTIPANRFIAPACVIDCSKEVAADESFILEPTQIEAFEAPHGRSPDHPTSSAHRAYRPLAGMCGSPGDRRAKHDELLQTFTCPKVTRHVPRLRWSCDPTNIRLG